MFEVQGQNEFLRTELPAVWHKQQAPDSYISALGKRTHEVNDLDRLTLP